MRGLLSCAGVLQCGNPVLVSVRRRERRLCTPVSAMGGSNRASNFIKVSSSVERKCFHCWNSFMPLLSMNLVIILSTCNSSEIVSLIHIWMFMDF
jgi:hypothetical protein